MVVMMHQRGGEYGCGTILLLVALSSVLKDDNWDLSALTATEIQAPGTGCSAWPRRPEKGPV
jgi:hypothetical protein